jgi:hypothetical protein
MSCIIHGSNARLLKLAFKGFPPTWPHRNSAAATSAQTAFTYEEQRLERVNGIEPSSSAWKAVALPLSYTRRRIAICPYVLERPHVSIALAAYYLGLL